MRNSLWQTKIRILRAKKPFTLTGGTVVDTEHKTTLTIQLIPADLNSIKANGDSVLRRPSCYLAAGVGLFKDFAGNSLEATKDLIISSLSPSRTIRRSPTLVSFGIDMNLGTLRLSFDETVDIDKLLRSGITVMNAKSGSNKVTLEPCPDGICSPSKIGDDITVSITDGDINKIKLLQFATKASDAFVSITDKTITDVARTPNAVEAVTANTAVVATLGYTKDQKSPKLLQFGFDLETGKLSMTFTEPVAPLTFKLGSVTLQGAKKLSAMVPQSKLTLKRGTVEEKDKNIAASMTITVKLVAEDVVAIKSDTGMYTSISDTYLSIAKGAVEDMVSLDVDAVDADAAMQASVHGADTSRGGVMKYVLDLAKRQVIFYFNEVVDVSSFKAGEITILSGKTLASSESHRLIGGSKVIGTADTATVTVQLSIADHIKLGENAKLATADTNTYMMMTAGTADDVLTRDLLAITDGNALQVDSVTPDTTAPEISTAKLDLTLETIVVTFSEPVNKLSFLVGEITLQGAEKAVPGVSTKKLTGHRGVSFNADLDTVTIKLSIADLECCQT